MDPTTNPIPNLTTSEPTLEPAAGQAESLAMGSAAGPAMNPAAGSAMNSVAGSVTSSPAENPATAATPTLNIPNASAGGVGADIGVTGANTGGAAQVFGIPEIDPSLIAATPSAGTGFDTSSLSNSGGAATPETPAFGATDPLTMPTPPKAPDPIEEELKAPLKAAGPVPGSIGSAISVPPEEGARSPEIPQQMMQPMQPAMPMKKAKKKTNKNTMILIGVVGALVIIALVAVLVMQILGK